VNVCFACGVFINKYAPKILNTAIVVANTGKRKDKK